MFDMISHLLDGAVGKATSSQAFHMLCNVNEASPDESERLSHVVLVTLLTNRLNVISRCLLFVLPHVTHDQLFLGPHFIFLGHKTV